jgi:glycosyltransferase involved in cell wall biosynthesis
VKRIRILEAIRQGNVGGGETHVFDLSTRLDKNRFEPIVLSFSDGPMVSNLRQAGIETHVINTKLPFDPRVIAQVKNLIIDRGIDVVHAHGTRAASNLLLPSILANRKMVYTVHGWSFNQAQPSWVYFIRAQAERVITTQTALNICVSESNRQTGATAIARFRATVINNGIDLDKFHPAIDNELLSKELNKKENEVWIGFIARITKQKDPITLLQAFYRAYQKNKHVRLLIVGEGDLQQEVESTIRALNLNMVVTVMPFRKDIPEILKTIDVYCLPSLWEGLPIGVIEAMAMEKPVIATRVDGTREIVTSETGLLIEPGDVSALANGFLQLAEDKNNRQQMGKNGRTLAEQRFGLTTMVNATEEAYLKVI